MPRYYVPPAPGTNPARTRSPWRLPLFLVGGGLLLVVGLLTPYSKQVLYTTAGLAALFLYFLLAAWPQLLGFGLLLYLVARVDRWLRPRRRVSPPRPAPYGRWSSWEVLLSLAALLLAVLYYAVVDGSRWLGRCWRKWRQRKATAWKAGLSAAHLRNASRPAPVSPS